VAIDDHAIAPHEAREGTEVRGQRALARFALAEAKVIMFIGRSPSENAVSTAVSLRSAWLTNRNGAASLGRISE
jgi:hypothetical protein